MKRPALRLRLLLASAASIAIALLLAGIGLSALFAAHVESRLRADLSAEMQRLVALLDVDTDPPTMTQDMPDPRFAVPFGGIYWQVTDPDSGAVVRSRSLWDSLLVVPARPAPSADGFYADIPDPQQGQTLALVRRLDFERSDGTICTLIIVMAENKASLDGANAAFRGDLAKALAILAVALLIAGWVQVTLGLAPLGAIQRGINAVRTGGTKALEGDYPAEVMPLVDEVNALLQGQETSISFARARAADLAHGLKTSLTVLVAEAHSLRSAGNIEQARAIEQLVVDMSDTIDHQLRLTRLRRRSGSDHQQTGLANAVNKVVATLKKTPRGAEQHWHVAVPDDHVVDLDGSDLIELVGVLAENATKWSNSRIDIASERRDGAIALVIEEDGPGLPDQTLAELGRRGQRLDEAKSGSGLGLSIAREIIALNGGQLSFDASPLGGLRVTAQLRRA